MLFNLHTHTLFSDGSSDPEKYIEEAIRQGFSILGFSDHSPVPFENSFALKEEILPLYCAAVRDLQKKYRPVLSEGSGAGEILPEILLGIEVDFIPGMTVPLKNLCDKYKFDYTIGSVHLVRNSTDENLWFIDGPDISIYDTGISHLFGGDGKKAVTAYFRQVQEMVAYERPDIIGHLDKVKMYNRGRYFSELDPWYTKLIGETLELIKAKGSVIEVNTRGLYKKRSDSLFPGEEVLKKILELKIPVCISSDAHKPGELSLLFPEIRKLLFDLGFRSQMMLSRGNWHEVSL